MDDDVCGVDLLELFLWGENVGDQPIDMGVFWVVIAEALAAHGHH